MQRAVHKIAGCLGLAVVCALAAGCKKGLDGNVWAGVYKTSAVMQVNAPKMYTHNGIITDVNFIKAFLQRDTLMVFGGRDTGFIFLF